MSKNQLLMEQIVCVYHPEFVKSQDLRNFGQSHAEIFNIERLIEESLAAVGGYAFVDAAGYDFLPDYSDSKTVSVVNNGKNKVIIISNVENKIGALRVTIYNPFNDMIDYMFIPPDAVAYLQENDGTKGTANANKKRIRTSWTNYTNYYNKLERFRVRSFVELATAV